MLFLGNYHIYFINLVGHLFNCISSDYIIPYPKKIAPVVKFLRNNFQYYEKNKFKEIKKKF